MYINSKLGNSIDLAAENCWLHTQQTKKEKMIAISPISGEWLSEEAGTDHQVDVPENVKHQKGLVIVHSHPDTSNFSGGDIRAAWMMKSDIFVVTTDRSLYKASGIKGNVDQVFSRSTSLDDMIKVIWSDKDILNDLIIPGTDMLVAKTPKAGAAHHAVLFAASQLGWFEYQAAQSNEVVEAMDQFYQTWDEKKLRLTLDRMASSEGTVIRRLFGSLPNSELLKIQP